VKALVSRLKSLATKPLWTEGHVQKSRRRWRLVLALPFALLGGLTWGWFAAAQLPEASRLLWSTLGAVSFGFFFYLQERLAPAVAAAGERIGIGGLALLAWEVGVIGGLVYLVTGVLGAPTVPAVAIAVSVGALYSIAAEYLLCGGAADSLLALVGRGSGISAAPRMDYSLAESFAVRGRLEEAAEVYEEAIGLRRRTLLPYLRLADIRSRMGVHDEAIRILRSAIDTARPKGQEESFVIRRIVEICSTSLGNRARAAPDLAGFLERRPEGEHAEWARHELAFIKAEIREQG
jgi:tetratricopeptide (TPR) repeat protein